MATMKITRRIRSIRMMINLLLDYIEQGYRDMSLSAMVGIFLNIEIPEHRKDLLENFVERRILK